MCYCQRHATYYAGRCPGCDADLQALIAMGKAVAVVRDDCGDEDDYPGDYYDPERDCPRCHGTGKVTTEDYESYLGAMYKPCPVCGGDPCVGQPPLS